MRIRGFAFVGHPVTSLKRAREFYETVLRLPEPEVIDPPHGPDGDDGFIEYAVGPHDTLAVTTTWSPGEPPAVLSAGLTVEVEDFEEAIAHIESCGVSFELGPFEGARCSIAVIKDPDGNQIGIHKRKEKPDVSKRS